ncbi:uncharacterized protein STEHIDRAFT_69093, partial [Stereum hirsutum FP-91666 SS1]
PRPRNYPPPPTGHELMRLFPPPPPDQFSILKPGPTSIYFHQQERAFFSQAGKEIVRVRVESDFQPSATLSKGGMEGMKRGEPWTAAATMALALSPHGQQQPAKRSESSSASVEEWRAPAPGTAPPRESRRRSGKHTKRVVVR